VPIRAVAIEEYEASDRPRLRNSTAQIWIDVTAGSDRQHVGRKYFSSSTSSSLGRGGAGCGLIICGAGRVRSRDFQERAHAEAGAQAGRLIGKPHRRETWSGHEESLCMNGPF
jgi:hypothetical protein